MDQFKLSTMYLTADTALNPSKFNYSRRNPMIISDLNYLEVASEDAAVNGGIVVIFPLNEAYAQAGATAVGFSTYTRTSTNTLSILGVGSSSDSRSASVSYVI